jgi:hypothetical protein
MVRTTGIRPRPQPVSRPDSKDGRLAPKGNPVVARHAEDALRLVGQAFAAIGAGDPRHDPRTGRLDFRLARQQAGYKKTDRPTVRKLPIPKDVLKQAHQLAVLAGTAKEAAISDLIWMAFFFLLRPGEYCWTTANGHPFVLDDVTFEVNARSYKATTTPLTLLPYATGVGLYFSQQKNGIKGEVITLTKSRDSDVCPVHVIANRIRHLHANHAPPNTPLFIYYSLGVQFRISDRIITSWLRLASSTLGLPSLPTAGALRTTGAQSLLNGGIPIFMIKLIGRWRSDEVFRYLHTSSTQLMQPFPEAMLHHASL